MADLPVLVLGRELVQGQLGSEDRFSWNGIHQTERTFEKAIDTDIESA